MSDVTTIVQDDNACAFASDGRRVCYVGANYNSAADVRTIDDVKCERA